MSGEGYYVKGTNNGCEVHSLTKLLFLARENCMGGWRLSGNAVEAPSVI